MLEFPYVAYSIQSTHLIECYSLTIQYSESRKRKIGFSDSHNLGMLYIRIMSL